MTFAEAFAAAVKDFTERGFTSEEQLAYWMDLIRRSAEQQATSARRLQDMLTQALRAVYARMVEHEGVVRQLGVGRFTLTQVAPRLRSELDRRIMASAQLIKLNRTQAIDETLRRFSGWATSIPQGGAAEPEARKTAEDVKKAMRSLPFVERRVLVDQGHKLTASISATVAEGGGAVAATWFSHWRQSNYDYREDHRLRDGKVYLLRKSWAVERGLVKPGPAGYADEITQPGEEVFCRCKFKYLFALRQLPADMLTAKGHEELERVRVH